MKLLNFVKTFIAERIGKNDLREHVRTIAQKLDQSVLVSVNNVTSTPELQKPKSNYGKKFTDDFNRYVPSSLRNRPGNAYFSVLVRSIKNAVSVAEQLDALIGKDVGDVIHVDGITYQKAIILRLIETIDFLSDYTSRQLFLYTAAETAAIALDQNENSLVSKAEWTYLNQYQHAYFKTLELFYQEPAKIMHSISAVPEVLITGPEFQTSPLASASDPLELNVIPLVSNFFLFAGERRADREVARYERVKKERRDIEMRIEIIKQKTNGGVIDTRTQAILDGYTRELTLAREKLAKMEERVS